MTTPVSPVYEEFVLIAGPIVHQRAEKMSQFGAESFSDAPGSCEWAHAPNDGSHPHIVPLTGVQTVLVADESFIRAYYGPAAALRLFRKTGVGA